MSNLLSIKDTSIVLGVSTQTVHSMVRKGVIKAESFIASSKTYYGIPKEEVDRLLLEMKPPGWAALDAKGKASEKHIARNAVNASEVARRLGVTRQYVNHLLSRGQFPNAYQEGRSWFVPVSDIEAFNEKKETA